MACYEVASLRLALFNLLGDRPAHERTHEVEELGSKLTEIGPLKSLAEATSLAELRAALDAAALELEQRVSDMSKDAPQVGYYRSLVVTVKRTQRDLARMSANLERYYQDLDEIHDVLHEIFPESD
jgi:cell division protein ZapA (FtsZ GTPase activity inhibitor)